MRAKFSKKTRYVRTDAWRGYNEPVYAVFGANNTGMASDSPCPTDVCKKELSEARKVLKESGIPTMLIRTESSNVFCSHVYCIVPPEHLEEAKKKFAEYFKEAKHSTRLLYEA